jgi:hypothetical protein
MKFDLRLLLALAIALLIFIPGAYGISFGGGISTSTNGYSQGNTVVAGQSLNSIWGSSSSVVDKNYYVKDLDNKYAEIKLHYEGGTVTGYGNVFSPRSGNVFSKPTQVSAQQKFTAVNAKLVRAQEKASNKAGDVASTSIEVSQGTIRNYVGTSTAKGTDVLSTQTIGDAFGTSVRLKEDSTYGSQGSHVDTLITQVNGIGADFKGSTESKTGIVTSALLTGHLSGALVSTGTANSLTKKRNSNGQAVDCDLMMKAYTGSQAVDSTATFFVQPNMKIQGAIDAAWKGETVNVAAGTYTENVVLNKPLTLAGAGRGDDQAFNTIIQAYLKDQPIITITSGDTTVKKLQVTGANCIRRLNFDPPI